MKSKPNQKSQGLSSAFKYLKLEPRRVLSVNTTLIGGVLDIDIVAGGNTEANLLVDPNDSSQFFVDSNNDSILDGGDFVGSISDIESVQVTGSDGAGGSQGTFRWLGDFSNAQLDRSINAATVSVTGVNHARLHAEIDVTGNAVVEADNLINLGGKFSIDGNARFESGGNIIDSANVELDITQGAQFIAGDGIELANESERLVVGGNASFETVNQDQIFVGVDSGTLQKSSAFVDLGSVRFDSDSDGIATSSGRVVIATDSDLRVTQSSFGDQVILTSEADILLSNQIIADDFRSESLGDTVAQGQVTAQEVHLESLGQMSLGGNITASEIFIESQSGASQTSGSDLIGDSLLLAGEGGFVLSQANQIGSPTTAGLLAVRIDGSLEFQNEFAIDAATLSVDGIGIRGISLNSTSGTGDLEIRLNDADLGQQVTSPVRVQGITSVDVGSGVVQWNSGDSNLNGILENDF